jgi:hypothetical protein
MMQGMVTGMYWGLVLGVFLLLGFAYIIWILAAKEEGGIKVSGQIIAAVIAILALLILIYGLAFGSRMGGYCGGVGPGGMMQNPELQKMMMQNLKK